VAKLCEFKTDEAVNALKVIVRDKSITPRVRAAALEHIGYTGKISLQDVKMATDWLSSDNIIYLREAARSLLWAAGGEIPCPPHLRRRVLKALYTAFAREKNSILRASFGHGESEDGDAVTFQNLGKVRCRVIAKTQPFPFSPRRLSCLLIQAFSRYGVGRELRDWALEDFP